MFLDSLRALFRRPSSDADPIGDPERVRAVEAVLSRLRPGFRADGGDVRLVEVTDEGRVRVRLEGACSGCGASILTLQGALRPALKESVPWFAGLESE